MYKCVLRDENGFLLMERHSEDVFEADLTWAVGSEEILKRGGSITFTYVGELQKCDSENGFI